MGDGTTHLVSNSKMSLLHNELDQLVECPIHLDVVFIIDILVLRRGSPPFVDTDNARLNIRHRRGGNKLKVRMMIDDHRTR